MDSKSSQSQFWRLSPDMFRKRGGRSSNYDTAEGFSGKPRCSVIKTHVRSVRNLRETEHFSGEFPNGSSADATGSNWRFQAENLRQITIYQLMKPLKFIPPNHHPTPVLLRHRPRRCITYERRLRSEEPLGPESPSHCVVLCYHIRPPKPNCVCGG